MRGFNVVAKIKSQVEKVCPGIVSCADIVAIAARDSTVIVSNRKFFPFPLSFFVQCFVETVVNFLQLGGPFWNVKLGRRDSKTASLSAANSGVIPPPTSTLSNLINRFNSKGLSVKDMVALSGTCIYIYIYIQLSNMLIMQNSLPKISFQNISFIGSMNESTIILMDPIKFNSVDEIFSTRNIFNMITII